MIQRAAFLYILVFSQSPCLSACSKEPLEKPVKDPGSSPTKPAPAVAPSSPESPSYHSVSRVTPARSGLTHIKGPRSAALKWVFRTEGRVYGDAAVSPEGDVIIPSHDGHLYAVDKTGRQKWAFDAGGKIWSSPAIAKDGTIFFGSDADRLFALTSFGEVKWIFSTEVPLKKGEKKIDSRWDVDTAPVIGKDGTVYFGCHYFLYALRPSGEVRWRFQAGVDRVKIFSSPAIGSDGTLFFGTQGKRLFAVDPNGEARWNVSTDGDNDSTPSAGDNGVVFFGSDDGKVRALGESTGEAVWEKDVGSPVRAPLALRYDGTVIAATYGKVPFVIALDRDSGEEKWRFATEPGDGAFYGIQSGPLVDGEGYLYFGGRDHFVYCLTPDGKLAWKYETGDQVDSSPVLGPDGTLYIGSDDKRLYAFGE